MIVKIWNDLIKFYIQSKYYDANKNLSSARIVKKYIS